MQLPNYSHMQAAAPACKPGAWLTIGYSSGSGRESGWWLPGYRTRATANLTFHYLQKSNSAMAVTTQGHFILYGHF